MPGTAAATHTVHAVRGCFPMPILPRCFESLPADAVSWLRSFLGQAEIVSWPAKRNSTHSNICSCICCCLHFCFCCSGCCGNTGASVAETNHPVSFLTFKRRGRLT